MKFFLMALVSFMLLSSGSFAADVSKFATVSEMVGEFGDYAKDNNTFKVLKSEPLHIQLAPIIMTRDSADNIKQTVNRAVVYGIYRSFAHTDIDAITVTVLPIMYDSKNKSKTDGEEHKKTVSISRDKALGHLQRYLDIRKISDVIKVKEVGGKKYDFWNKKLISPVYYDGRNSNPGVNRFVSEME